jgi:hypothetical protein
MTCFSAFLGGRPFFIWRIASAASAGYKASLVMGFIPIFSRRFSAVWGLIPRIAAISVMVNPFMVLFYYITFGKKRYFFHFFFKKALDKLSEISETLCIDKRETACPATWWPETRLRGWK